MTARLALVEPHSGAMEARPQADDRALVERSRDGDREAFALLYRRYVDRLHAFAYRRTGSRQAAEDVTAAAFERAWRSLPGFEWQGRGFEPWLFRIAANEVVHHYRQARRLTVVSDVPASSAGSGRHVAEPGERIEAAEAADEMRAALGTLRPRYQLALSLRYLADLSPAEAAEAMGCSKSTFAVVVHRALRALENALQENR